MKRTSALVIFLLVLFAPFSAAHANSMPGHWEYGESSGSVFVLSGENLAVEHETLSFDIPQTSDGMIPAANVSAEYRIKNSGESRTVTMLFPILFSAEDVPSLAEDMQVFVDSQEQPCTFLLMNFPGEIAYIGAEELRAFRVACQIQNILAQMQVQSVAKKQFTPSELEQKYKEASQNGETSPNLLLVMYETKFDAGQEHDVELQYMQRSAELSDDAPNDLTAKFYCMLNPAKTFEEFGTLDIAIQIHKPNTQLTADGFAFKLQDGVYRASFNTLPTQDLYFTARHDSRTEVQKKDPVSGFIGSAIAVLYIIVGIAVFSTIVIEIAAIKSVLSRRRYKKDH